MARAGTQASTARIRVMTARNRALPNMTPPAWNGVTSADEYEGIPLGPLIALGTRSSGGASSAGTDDPIVIITALDLST